MGSARGNVLEFDRGSEARFPITAAVPASLIGLTLRLYFTPGPPIRSSAVLILATGDGITDQDINGGALVTITVARMNTLAVGNGLAELWDETDPSKPECIAKAQYVVAQTTKALA